MTIVTCILELNKGAQPPQLMEEHTSRWDALDKTAPLSGPYATGVERSPVARAVCNSGARWLATPSHPVTSSTPALSFLSSQLSFDTTSPSRTLPYKHSFPLEPPPMSSRPLSHYLHCILALLEGPALACYTLPTSYHTPSLRLSYEASRA